MNIEQHYYCVYLISKRFIVHEFPHSCLLIARLLLFFIMGWSPRKRRVNLMKIMPTKTIQPTLKLPAVCCEYYRVGLLLERAADREVVAMTMAEPTTV
jgi:hypothetical protein